MSFLPYGRQEVADADVEAVVAALRSPMLTQGPQVERFEEAFADKVEAAHAVAFSSGTAALHGAAFAAGLGEGDNSITTPLTFVASANCALYQGASPRLVDVDPHTLNLDCLAAAEVADERTKAVVPVSFAGLPVDMDQLAGVRDRLTVIEDACHALGGHRDGRPVGGAGGADITCFSTHPVKAMTTGEGGVATTEDPSLADAMRAFRTHGIHRDDLSPSEHEGGWYMEMRELGFNYRITDIQCALGISQLQRLDSWVERRNEIALRYRERLSEDERVQLPPSASEGSLHGYHLFVIRVRDGAARRLSAFEGLRAVGIGVQVHYIPVYRMPYYRDTLGYPQDECPATEAYYEGAISIPMFPAMTDADVDRVVTELQKLL